MSKPFKNLLLLPPNFPNNRKASPPHGAGLGFKCRHKDPILNVCKTNEQKKINIYINPLDLTVTCLVSSLLDTKIQVLNYQPKILTCEDLKIKIGNYF